SCQPAETLRAFPGRRPRRPRCQWSARCRRAFSCGRSRLESRSVDVASLRRRHQLQHVAIRIAKVKAAATAPIVELAVLETPRRAAEDDLGLFDAAKNRVEVAIGDMESEMMTVKIRVIIEQQGQSLVHPYRREVSSARTL